MRERTINGQLLRYPPLCIILSSMPPIFLPDNYCGTPHCADFLLRCPPINDFDAPSHKSVHTLCQATPYSYKVGYLSKSSKVSASEVLGKLHGIHCSVRFFSCPHLMLSSTSDKLYLILMSFTYRIFGGVGTSSAVWSWAVGGQCRKSLGVLNVRCGYYRLRGTPLSEGGMEERWGPWKIESCMMGGTGAVVR